MVWQIVNKVDTETAKKTPLFARSPFIEMEAVSTSEVFENLKKGNPKDIIGGSASKNQSMSLDWMMESVKYTNNLPSPRVIKTHLPLEFLPSNLLDTCKVIYVNRNPKDACVSFYHHHVMFPENDLKGSFSDFAQAYLQGAIKYGSYWTMLKVRHFAVSSEL